MILKYTILLFLLLPSHFVSAQGDVVMSLNGTTLNTHDLQLSNKDFLVEELLMAEKAFEKNPEDLNTLIWYGRRLAYLNRFNEAIIIFSKGLKEFPKNPELLRHRGHRYLTTRNLDLAKKDFSMAAKTAKKLPLQSEMDGRPNEQNKPLGNLQRNIYYHWALTQYCAGNYHSSAALWKKCLEYCQYIEMKVSVWDWLFLTYLKSGKDKLAKEILNDLPQVDSLMENDNYYQRLLMYQRHFPEKNLSVEPDTSAGISMAYGFACLAESKGETTKANQILQEIMKTRQWNSFSYLAAEADLSRMNKK